MTPDTIYTGDNVAALKTFPDTCIDLVVTSPPYDNLRTYGGHTWDFEGVARELTRVLKPGGVIVWVVADAMGENYMLGRLSEAMPEEVPSFERWDREWNKPNAWKDPEKLTSEARTMVSQLKVHVERLEGELRGAMVEV